MTCLLLKPLQPVLRVDEAVALALLAVLQHDGRADEEDHVDAWQFRRSAFSFFIYSRQIRRREREREREAGRNERGLLTNNAKVGGEDEVEEDVGEGGEGADAALLLRRDEGACADAVLLEGREGAVDVAAAVELYISH